jgi:hypothetical protein
MDKFVINSGKFSKQRFSFFNNLMVIYGQSGEEKSLLLNNIAKGFRGQLKNNFLFNDQQVSIGDYQVVYLNDTFDINDEFKMTKSNPLRDEILKFINNSIIYQGKETFSSRLDGIGMELNDLISSLFVNVENNPLVKNLEFKTALNLQSIETIIDKFLKVTVYDNDLNNEIDTSKINKFTIRMLLFKLLHLYVDWNDELRNVIFILDLPFMGSDIRSTIQLLNYFNSLINKKARIIFTVNNPDVFHHLPLDIRHINYVSAGINKKVDKIDSIIKNAICLASFLESEEHDLVIYKNDFLKVFDENDIKNEINYFNQNCLFKIINCVTANKVVLYEGVSYSDSFNISEDTNLNYQCTDSKRNIIILYCILLSFKSADNITITGDFTSKIF